MATARGFVTEPVQFNLPVLQMPFEAAYAQMEGMQQTKDQYDALAEMMPSYLSNVEDDVDKANKYRQFVDTSTQRISDAFSDGDLSTAMKLLNTAKRDLTKEWRPGGLAHVLQTRYDQYTQGQQAVQDHTKDFTQPGYDQYFMGQLDAQAQKGTGYNPDTGKYNNISTPNMFGEVNLGSEVDNYLEGWAADKGYNIKQSPDGFWYHVESHERVDAGELQQALQGFYNRPDINRALQVQSWAQAQSVPANMREQYTDRFRAEMANEANTLISRKRTQLGSIQEMLDNGKNIGMLQKELNNMGYNLDVTGELDEATITAAEGFLENASAELDATTQMIGSRIQNMTLEEGFMRQQQETLTSAYVPKYAFDATEVKMVANTPLIAMMKMRAASQALDGLKALFIRPDVPLVGGVKAEERNVGSIPQQYKQAKENYQQLETEFISGMSPAFQTVLLGKTVPTGKVSHLTKVETVPSPLRPDDATIGIDKATTIHRTRSITQAIHTASQGEEFDPIVYRDALRSQGIIISDNEFKNHSELFANRDNRMAMETVNNELSPAYIGVEVTGEIYRDFTEKVAKNADQIDWDVIARRVPVSEVEAASGTQSYLSYALNKGLGLNEGGLSESTKRRFLNGDPMVVESVQKWVQENNSQFMENISGIDNVDVIISDNLEPYRDKFESKFMINPLSQLNVNEMDKATLNALGYDKNAKRLEGDEQPRILGVQFGKRNINGRSIMVGLVSTDKSDSPVVIPTSQINMNFLQEYVRTGAAATMNPDNPGEIMDPETFSMFSSMYYDLGNNNGTGYNANTLARIRERGTYGRVGIETPNIMGYQYKVETLFLPSADGSQDYLVTTDAATARRILQGSFDHPTGDGDRVQTYGVITPEMRRVLEANKETQIINVPPGYDGIKRAIDESKATLVDPIMQREILTHPLKYTRAPNNQTQNALPIGTSIYNMINN